MVVTCTIPGHCVSYFLIPWVSLFFMLGHFFVAFPAAPATSTDTNITVRMKTLVMIDESKSPQAQI